jgi:hypothetical protein
MMNETKEIFAAAGLSAEDHLDLAEKVEQIMIDTEAELSVLYGLSRKRIELYESQKQSLIDELIEFKKSA